MLLHQTSPKPPLNLRQEHDNHAHFSSTIPNALSFSSSLLQNPTFAPRHHLILSRRTHRNPVLATRSSASDTHGRRTRDYERKPLLKWNSIFKKISMMPDPNAGAASVLNRAENDGKKLTKWELSRVVKELRKFRRFKYALEVYEWINNRPERFRVTSSDTAIQLDLIAKVHGVPSAEKYFRKLPETLKDNRIYGSLLNAYARARLRENAETLMDEMRERAYLSHSLPFNVMMTLYRNLEEHGKIESLVSEMKERNIAFDGYTYNIWLSSLGTRGSVQEMERVFNQMETDPSVNPNWTTYGTMATAYIKLGNFEKGEECLKEIEKRLTGGDRMPYHYLISLYGSARKKEDVYRMWRNYKAKFANVTNLGYHSIISSLVRIEDIEGAEEVYDEWFKVKSSFDARVGNLLLSAYVRRGLDRKAEALFEQMSEPNAVSWEIIGEKHLRDGNLEEALCCLEKAAEVEGGKKWKPKPVNVSNIVRISEERGNAVVKDVLVGIMRRQGCLDDDKYMSYVPLSADGEVVVGGVLGSGEVVGDGDESFGVLNQLQESF